MKRGKAAPSRANKLITMAEHQAKLRRATVSSFIEFYTAIQLGYIAKLSIAKKYSTINKYRGIACMVYFSTTTPTERGTLS